MNNNNHPYQYQYQPDISPPTSSSTSSTSPIQSHNPRQSPSLPSFPLYQNLTPTSTSRPETFERFKGGDGDFKERNKAMYQSTMNYGSYSDSMPSLSAFGRKVQEGRVETGDERFMAIMSKYADQSGKDTKMASSAIFTDNPSNTQQFNRFPSFNLPTSPNIPRPVSSKQPPQQSPSESNPAQTPKQKRERQIAAIKKQLESLNKKMLNKPIPNISSTVQEFRSPKHSAVSQSVIIQGNSGMGYNVGGLGDYSSPKNYDGGFEDKFKSKKYSDFTKTQLPHSSKPQPQPQKPTPIPTYSTSTTTPVTLPTSQNKFDFNPPPITSKYNNYDNSGYTSYADKYSGNSVGGGSSSFNNVGSGSGSGSSYPYSFGGSTGSSYQGQGLGKTTGYNAAETNIGSYKYSYDNKVGSNPTDYTNFSKKTQTPEQTGFKKKKFFQPQPNPKPQPQSYLPQDPKPTYNPISLASTSGSVSSERGFKVKKIDSFNYIDESISVPQMRNFKYSDFVIGKKMGKGQFGEVLLVRHKATGWLCGLKVMEKKEIRDQDYVSQIARELSIQFYLSHRNIAQLYGYFQDESKFYLLIQFCTGGQLLERLRKQKRMSEQDVSKIIRQTCQGIDYIHKQQIIHRDLKPQNILFNFGVVKISDFGWAVYRGFGMRKTASGSPLYYPPQIVKGEEYDDKVDVWNIGMMTYQCLLGKIPFRVYSELDLGKIVSDQITFPSYVDVSDEAKDFILKTMNKKGQQRIQLRQMLRHPFLSKNKEIPLSQQILDQFRRVLE